MHVKTATEGKTKDVAITDVTPENYIVPSNEQHLYHCIIEVLSLIHISEPTRRS